MAEDKDKRSRKDKLLDKLGDVVFGTKGSDNAVGEEADEFLRDHGSSGKGDKKDEGGKT
jgi:hypothetical protein